MLQLKKSLEADVDKQAVLEYASSINDTVRGHVAMCLNHKYGRQNEWVYDKHTKRDHACAWVAGGQ